jgi:HlyD family secretion protein
MARLKTNTDEDKLKALFAKKSALKRAYNIAMAKYETALGAKAQIKALKNAIAALNAKKSALEVVISDLSIKSPINGFVDTKVANVGEVLGAGMPVAMLIDPKSYYVKIYVNEITNGKIKVGDKAEIFLDSFPNKPIPAVVSKIAKKAEFTPKEVATRSDRITRVYEVRLKPLEENPYLKLGLPATGVILIGNGRLPSSLNQLPPM